MAASSISRGDHAEYWVKTVVHWHRSLLRHGVKSDVGLCGCPEGRRAHPLGHQRSTDSQDPAADIPLHIPGSSIKFAQAPQPSESAAMDKRLLQALKECIVVLLAMQHARASTSASSTLETAAWWQRCTYCLRKKHRHQGIKGL